MQTPDIFLTRQANLNKAISKVDTVLNTCFIECKKGIISEKDGNIMNHLHDTKDRLELRLKANYSDYKTWHWETFQFNTY
jgi:hypothetical protein